MPVRSLRNSHSVARLSFGGAQGAAVLGVAAMLGCSSSPTLGDGGGGAGTDDAQGSTTFQQGDLGGKPFVVASTLFFEVEGGTDFVFWSTPGLCDYLGTDASVDQPFPKNSEGLGLGVTPAVSEPGTYSFSDGEGQLALVNGDCMPTIGDAVDGSLTLDVVTADEVRGSFFVNVHGAATTGTFDAVACAAEIDHLPANGSCP
jgi:hypothetical protein